jgi:O-antigen ligase
MIQLVEIVVVVPVLFASVAPNHDTVRVGLLTFSIAAFVLGIVAIGTVATTLGGGDFESLELPGGLNKNVVGSFTGAGLAFCFTLLIAGTEPRWRNRLLVAVVVLLVATIATVSRGSILGALVAMVIAPFLLGRKRLATTAGVALITAAYLFVIGPEAPDRADAAGSYDSSVVRVYTFKDAIEKIGERPVLGTGHGTYYVFIDELQIGVPDPNNMFLLTWAELGFVGLLALLFMLWRYGQTFIRSRSLPPAEAATAIGAGAMTLSLFVHFQVDVTWTRGTTSLAFAMMGAMLALHRLALAESPEEHPVSRAATPARVRSPELPSVRV